MPSRSEPLPQAKFVAMLREELLEGAFAHGSSVRGDSEGPFWGDGLGAQRDRPTKPAPGALPAPMGMGVMSTSAGTTSTALRSPPAAPTPPNSRASRDSETHGHSRTGSEGGQPSAPTSPQQLHQGTTGAHRQGAGRREGGFSSRGLISEAELCSALRPLAEAEEEGCDRGIAAMSSSTSEYTREHGGEHQQPGGADDALLQPAELQLSQMQSRERAVHGAGVHGGGGGARDSAVSIDPLLLSGLQLSLGLGLGQREDADSGAALCGDSSAMSGGTMGISRMSGGDSRGADDAAHGAYGSARSGRPCSCDAGLSDHMWGSESAGPSTAGCACPCVSCASRCHGGGSVHASPPDPLARSSVASDDSLVSADGPVLLPLPLPQAGGASSSSSASSVATHRTGPRRSVVHLPSRTAVVGLHNELQATRSAHSAHRPSEASESRAISEELKLRSDELWARAEVQAPPRAAGTAAAGGAIVGRTQPRPSTAPAPPRRRFRQLRHVAPPGAPAHKSEAAAAAAGGTGASAAGSPSSLGKLRSFSRAQGSRSAASESHVIWLAGNVALPRPDQHAISERITTVVRTASASLGEEEGVDQGDILAAAAHPMKPGGAAPAPASSSSGPSSAGSEDGQLVKRLAATLRPSPEYLRSLVSLRELTLKDGPELLRVMGVQLDRVVPDETVEGSVGVTRASGSKPEDLHGHLRYLHLVVTGPSYGIDLGPSQAPAAPSGHVYIGAHPTVVAGVSRRSPFASLLKPGDQLIAAGGIDLTSVKPRTAARVMGFVGARATPQSAYLLTFLVPRTAAVRARLAAALEAQHRLRSDIVARYGTAPPVHASRPGSAAQSKSGVGMNTRGAAAGGGSTVPSRRVPSFQGSRVQSAGDAVEPPAPSATAEVTRSSSRWYAELAGTRGAYDRALQLQQQRRRRASDGALIPGPAKNSNAQAYA